MKKSFIYMAIVMAMFLGSCSVESSNEVVTGLKTKTPDNKPEPEPDPTPQDTTKVDTTKWDVVTGNNLIVNPDNMMATAYLKYVKNGIEDSIWTESWKLDIKAEDMIINRDFYQPTIVKGRTPDAQRSTDPEFKDKYGNMQTRHYYTQRIETNNFTHSISGAWNTAYVLVKGKPEYFWPYDGLYFELNKLEGVGDTIHIVRNDSILAVEDLDAEYKATLRVDKQSYSRYVYYIKANIKVYSFVGLVEKKEEIPSANHYGAGINWHAAKGNRFHDGQNWHDAFLFASETNYYILVHFYTVDRNGKESNTGQVKFYTIPKSEMMTPTADRQYDAVIWDPAKGKPLPCRIAVDGSGWTSATQYADGTVVSKREGQIDADISGIKNQPENHNVKATPWIEVNWGATTYNGKNYYNMSWKTTAHTDADTVADASLK